MELLPHGSSFRAKEVIFDIRILTSACGKASAYRVPRSMEVAWKGHCESGLDAFRWCPSINGYEMHTAEE